jgi:uncharacterized protein YggE
MMRSSLALLLYIPAGAFAQTVAVEGDSSPRIIVTATKTTRIIPDRVTTYVTVEGTGESPSDATQRASTKLQAVMTAVRSVVSGTDAVVAMPYGVTPTPNMNGFPGGTSGSYVARHVVRIQPRSVDQTTAIASAAIAAGAGGTSPPWFESSIADSVRRAKYGEALAQAQRDAESLASSLGGRLGPFVEVTSTGSVNQGQNSFISFINRYDYAGPTGTPDVIVNATVTVKYRFIPR